MKWKILDTGMRSAEENMAIDANFLTATSDNVYPVLHLYEWKQKSATFGYFLDPFSYLNEEGVRRHALELARRPTGGGITFHVCDLAFSVFVPSSSAAYSSIPLENYAFINAKVLEAIGRFSNVSSLSLLSQESDPLDESCRHFCMSKATKYDVMWGGRKVGGAAQRKTKDGFLHQGTIFLALPSRPFLEDVLKPSTLVLEGMQKNSLALLGDQWSEIALKEAKSEMKDLLKQVFEKCS